MFCKFCGEKIEENTLYCSKCGAKTDSHNTISAENLNTDKTDIPVVSKKEKIISKKFASIIQKCCFAGFVAGIIGVILFLGIVLIGLIAYGKVYLFDGYDFTKVLSIISIVLMIIGVCGFILKCISSFALKIGKFPTTMFKKILVVGLAIACLGCSIWGFASCKRSNFYSIYSECSCSYPWAEYGSDFLSIDTNPYDFDSDSSMSTYYMSMALSAIRSINSKLELPSYLYDEMLGTRALDGRQTYSGTKVDVAWKYHPDSGLEVRYTKK